MGSTINVAEVKLGGYIKFRQFKEKNLILAISGIATYT